MGVHLFRAPRVFGCIDDVVDVQDAEDRRERTRGNEHAILVAAVIGGILCLLDHDADDDERNFADGDDFPDCLALTEELAFHFITEDDDAPPLLQVEIVDEPPARFRDDIAHLTINRINAGDGRVDDVLADAKWRIARAVLRTDVVDVADLFFQQPRIILDQRNGPSDAEAFVRLCGLRGKHDGDALADPVHVDGKLLLESHAECEQHDDRHCSPYDAEDRKKGSQFLGAEVAEEFGKSSAQAIHGIIGSSNRVTIIQFS